MDLGKVILNLMTPRLKQTANKHTTEPIITIALWLNLTALPERWTKGSVEGLLLRGNITLQWLE